MNNKSSFMELYNVLEESLTLADIYESNLVCSVSKAITDERMKRGMSQKEFAELLGVTQASVSKWEAGDCNFTLRKIAEIAAKLDLRPDVSLDPSNSAVIRPSANLSTKVIDMAGWKGSSARTIKSGMYQPEVLMEE